MNKRILIVEDDLSLGFLLMEFLETEGFDVKLCRDGDSGLSSFQNGRFDLCLIDVMLPKMDGFCLAKKIRMNCQHTPFIFLTARSMKRDKLEGYSLGAEDYVTKPFDEDELLCKIQVIMRRNKGRELKDTQPTEFQIGKYFYNSKLQELTFDGIKKRLTEKENDVLHLLCLNQNQILRRQDAVEKIYGKYDYFLGRSFDVFISRLRKMLNQDENICIENVFKVGFILKVQADVALP